MFVSWHKNQYEHTLIFSWKQRPLAASMLVGGFYLFLSNFSPSWKHLLQPHGAPVLETFPSTPPPSSPHPRKLAYLGESLGQMIITSVGAGLTGSKRKLCTRDQEMLSPSFCSSLFTNAWYTDTLGRKGWRRWRAFLGAICFNDVFYHWYVELKK